MKRIALLGSTGSVGEQTLAVAAAFPERFRISALAAGRRIEKLAAQVQAFAPELVATADPEGAEELRARLDSAQKLPEIVSGAEGLLAVALHPAELLVSALVGAVGLAPTLAALRAGRNTALANKEALVMAGALFGREREKSGAQLLPVDSEHSAVFQLLEGRRAEDLVRIQLTASGGPFRTWSSERIAKARVEQALAHPNWSMGPKISVDSATMMNKSLEIVEARWLFDLPPERISVLVHPQSIVHSLVELRDGSLLAQLGVPDMKQPIALALSWPERLPPLAPLLDLAALGRLDFEAPDEQRFPCLALARLALAGSETAPAALNAANEEAVAAFLDGRLSFGRIAEVNARTLDTYLQAHSGLRAETLEDVLAADAAGRREAKALIEAYA